MPIRMGDVELQPGEKKAYSYQLGHYPDGTPFGLPLVGVMGRQPGPVVGIVAGIHGDEFEGPEAVRTLVREIDPHELRGGIVCTPQANLDAMEVFNRVGSVDHLDLNRSFPGNADGFLTQRVAAVLVREIVEQCNFMVDLHSAGLAYDLYPYVGFNSTPGEIGEKSFAMAKAFGLSLLYGSTPFPNVLRLEAARRGIPAILVEAGGEGRCQPEPVRVMIRGLKNVLCHLGMLDGEPEELPETYTLAQAPPGGEFRHFPTGGFVRNQARLGSVVERGDLLATVVDVFGNELARIEAHTAGIILECRTVPVARIGDWAYAIANIVGTAQQDTPLHVALGGTA